MSAKEAVESGTEPAEGDHDGDQRSTGETKVAEEPTPSENGTAGASSIPVSVSRPRYDWYQTSSDVYINVMMKKLKKEEISVSFGENEVRIGSRFGSIRKSITPILIIMYHVSTCFDTACESAILVLFCFRSRWTFTKREA